MGEKAENDEVGQLLPLLSHPGSFALGGSASPKESLQSTAFQYARLGLRCNAIASGGVETNIMASVDPARIDQAALARLGAYHATNPGMLQPIDLANLALFLASDEARYINGAIIPADMGWRAA